VRRVFSGSAENAGRIVSERKSAPSAASFDGCSKGRKGGRAGPVVNPGSARSQQLDASDGATAAASFGVPPLDLTTMVSNETFLRSRLFPLALLSEVLPIGAFKLVKHLAVTGHSTIPRRRRFLGCGSQIQSRTPVWFAERIAHRAQARNVLRFRVHRKFFIFRADLHGGETARQLGRDAILFSWVARATILRPCVKSSLRPAHMN